MKILNTSIYCSKLRTFEYVYLMMKYEFMSARRYHPDAGHQTKYWSINARNLHRVPENMDFDRNTTPLNSGGRLRMSHVKFVAGMKGIRYVWNDMEGIESDHAR